MAYTDRFPIVNNFLETRLSADCDEGETTLYIESVDALPRIIVGRDYIPLVLRDAGSVREIVYVDSVDADSGAVIVRRGQEGTNATAWSAGSYVYCTVTADSFQRMRVNGFAPLADGTSGRPEISVTSSTTASIAGDYTAQIEVGMAVRVLAGDSVVEPNDATMGAIHISGVEYSGSVTTLTFQNVTLPKNVSGLDLGLSVAAAPMYHPDTLVADNITTSQDGNVISAYLAVQMALQSSEGQVSSLDASLRALVAAEVAAVMAAVAAAQGSADAASAGLVGVVRSINGSVADASGNVDISTAPTAGTGISVSGQKVSLATVVTAGNAGPTANASPAHGGTFTVPYITYDAYGRVTGRTNRTITLPAAPSSVTTATKATTTPNVACAVGNSAFYNCTKVGTTGDIYAQLPSGGTWRYITTKGTVGQVSGGSQIQVQFKNEGNYTTSAMLAIRTA